MNCILIKGFYVSLYPELFTIINFKFNRNGKFTTTLDNSILAFTTYFVLCDMGFCMEIYRLMESR